MLSAEQQKMRELSQSAARAVRSLTYDNYTVNVRVANSDYDASRIAELWANLAMIQQMHGNDFWLSKQTKSGLAWIEYIKKIIALDESSFIVFEDTDKVFGFAFTLLEVDSAEETTAKVRELYLEPTKRPADLNERLTEMLKDCLKDLGVTHIEFDLK